MSAFNPCPELAELSAGSASSSRIARLRAACADAGLEAFLVRDTSNIQWLTAFDNVFDLEAAHAFYLDGACAVLHTDSRYSSACRKAALGSEICVDDSRVSHAQFAAERWAKGRAGDAAGAASPESIVEGTSSENGVSGLSSGDGSMAAPAVGSLIAVGAQCLGVEDSISLGEYRKLQAAFAELGESGLDAKLSVGSSEASALGASDGCEVSCKDERISVSRKTAQDRGPAVSSADCLRETSGFVLGLRAVKDADEIRRMKAAQAVTDAAFAHIRGFVRPGMTEREVQLELEDFMLRNGASGLAFSSIVAAGANGANPHAIPGDVRLEAGQCVVMDFGARALGYCSDMTRMVFLGEPDARLCGAYEALRRANEEVEAMLRPGVTGAEAHDLAERILTEGGFAGKMGHGLGHGVGIDIHEEPVLAPRNKQPLVVGNVVTVEPGIYLPGEFGMRLEDFGVVTESGFDVFTRSTHEMVIV